MTTKHCGCSTETCGCCEGVEKLTPAKTTNRPGLPALRYRVGTHGTFFETMKARLSNVPVEAPGADGQTLDTFRPLTGLTTRDPSDPAIALLDGWATVADVLTFYQERIANEGYLRTAIERRSILELARLVGYSLRPGVASTVYLAYGIEDKQLDPVEIPVGSRAQSIPGPDELSQSFEAIEKFVARSAWNNLQVRLTRPADITLGNILSLETLYIGGITANLKAGDMLLFVFGPQRNQKAVRTVAKVELQTGADRTMLRLAPLPIGTAEALPVLDALIEFVHDAAQDPANGAAIFALRILLELRLNTFLGQAKSPLEWPEILDDAYDGVPPKDLAAAFAQAVKKAVEQATTGVPVVTTSPDEFVSKLLMEPNVQPASSLRLRRNLTHELGKGSDAHAQLLVNFAPKLKDSYYAAWSNANVNAAVPPLEAVYVLRLKASIFGASAPKVTKFSKAGDDPAVFTPTSPDDATDFDLLGDETSDSLFLEQAFETVAPDSFAIVQIHRSPWDGFRRVPLSIASVVTGQRSAYGVNGKSTRLQFTEAWRPEMDDDKSKPDFGAYRQTLVYAQSELLKVVENPILEPVNGQEIELGALYNELVSGRWVIFSGERADIAGVAGVRVSELMMISGLRQDYDSTLPGDKTHTTLLLATPTAFTYKRETLTIFGNVVKATHGETRNETLGAGDGSQALQAFTLKQPPLTFVPAPTAVGVESTLHVYVNNIEWHETDSLAGLGPKDRQFITKNDDNAATTVIFGNGINGSRLPTGVENIKAVYRNGIGKGGNVKAEQISLLQSKPLGVKSVINPLRASGGADKEDRDQARENAPLAVASLDRLVGLQDYSDFTRTFAGIAKADARRLSDGSRQLIHITIAGADDIPIDPTSDLYRNLLTALRKNGDEALPVRIELRELIVLVLSAKVRLLPDYLWEPVALAIRTVLLDTFGFHKRALGQAALLCEVISAIQSVEGVSYVDVDAFGGIPEKKAELDKNDKPTGKRRLLTLDELAKKVQEIVDPSVPKKKGAQTAAQRVDVNVAAPEFGSLRPAQLAILTPAVPDTLILNQII
jgi:hypothetical protein